MPYDVRRFAMVLGTGLMCLVLPASAADAQPGPQPFEIAVGTQYGLQDPERPVTPGWILASGFDLGGHSFVLEGTWHRETYVLVHPWDLDEVFRESTKSRYLMVLGGVRSRERQGRVVPYYQFLGGGFAFRFRTDNEWPASVPGPEFREERATGFVMQPGMGVDLNVWRRLTLRLAADLPILADRDYVGLRPKLSARVVVGFGR